MKDLTPDEIEKLTFKRCGVEEPVFRCMETGMYHFANTSMQFDGTPYSTVGKCAFAFNCYIRESLAAKEEQS